MGLPVNFPFEVGVSGVHVLQLAAYGLDFLGKQIMFCFVFPISSIVAALFLVSVYSRAFAVGAGADWFVVGFRGL